MQRTPRQHEDDARLAAAKEWQADERAQYDAAVERIRELAATTPDPVRAQR